SMELDWLDHDFQFKGICHYRSCFQYSLRVPDEHTFVPFAWQPTRFKRAVMHGYCWIEPRRFEQYSCCFHPAPTLVRQLLGHSLYGVLRGTTEHHGVLSNVDY